MSLRARCAALFTACVGAAVALPAAGARADEKAAVVESGRKVSVEYTLTVDGGVADTNVGKDPLTYEHGAGNMLPAFEEQLAGLKAGASKEFDLTPDQGYGPVNEALFQTVEAAEIPAEARKVGTMLVAQNDSGQKRPVRVHKVKDDKIVLDLNHPLAGKKLHFAVKVLSVE
jgi:FKBP-type peptidyl-prolyl cis-trans isomerase 2